MPRYKKIYEDKWLLVIDKPNGLLTVGSDSDDEISLWNLLRQEYQNKQIKIFPCHRLDKDTSGLVIFAKDKLMQKQIMDLFRQRKIKKKYMAVVQGWIEKQKGKIQSYLSNYPGTERKLAITRYKVIRRNPEYSVLEVEPLTGRKNQIRIHFKKIGHPIVGERRFSFARDYELKTKNLCLHAYQLEFLHPRTKKFLRLISLLPAEIKKFL